MTDLKPCEVCSEPNPFVYGEGDSPKPHDFTGTVMCTNCKHTAFSVETWNARTPMTDELEGAPETTHVWHKRHGNTCCKNCGLFKSADGVENPCNGVFVVDQRVKPLAPEVIWACYPLSGKRKHGTIYGYDIEYFDPTAEVDEDFDEPCAAEAYTRKDISDKRIAELEAECVRLGKNGAERYWEERWRDANAELATARNEALEEAAKILEAHYEDEEDSITLKDSLYLIRILKADTT